MFTFVASCIQHLALSLVLGATVVRAEPIIGLANIGSESNVLLRFDSASPGTAIPVPITGLTPGDNLIGIDIRPSNRLLYGLAFENRLYTIDPLTGIATLVANLSPDPSDSTDPFSHLFGIGFGVDFNPVADLLALPSLRVISPNQSLRVNANNGPTITDTNFPSFINASAYDNNDTLPSTPTTLYGFNRTDGTLVSSTNPNAGTYATQGSLGVDVDSFNGFDISGTGIAYAALTPRFGGEYELYTIDLSTGAATSLGAFDQSYDLRGIAAQPLAPIPEPSTFLLISAALLVVVATARKRGPGVLLENCQFGRLAGAGRQRAVTTQFP